VSTLPDSPSDSPFVRLDDLLKLAGAVGSGGQAKAMIQGGDVKVNGEVDTRRGKKLREGDTVTVAGTTFDVTTVLREHEAEQAPPPPKMRALLPWPEAPPPEAKRAPRGGHGPKEGPHRPKRGPTRGKGGAPNRPTGGGARRGKPSGPRREESTGPSRPRSSGPRREDSTGPSRPKSSGPRREESAEPSRPKSAWSNRDEASPNRPARPFAPKRGGKTRSGR